MKTLITLGLLLLSIVAFPQSNKDKITILNSYGVPEGTIQRNGDKVTKYDIFGSPQESYKYDQYSKEYTIYNNYGNPTGKVKENKFHNRAESYDIFGGMTGYSIYNNNTKAVDNYNQNGVKINSFKIENNNAFKFPY